MRSTTSSSPFSALENHYAATFAQEHAYAATLEQLSTLQVTITDQIAQLGAAQQEMTRLERELSDAVKGAEQINDFMQSYFGKKTLRIRVTIDQRFQITRMVLPPRI